MNKKLLASVLALLLILPLALPFTALAVEENAAEASEAKAETKVNGYEVVSDSTPVSTAAEFEAMKPNGVYHLTQDIDFGGKIYTNYILAEFSGTLNGCGYKIFNYTLTKTAGGDCGTIYRTCYTGATTITNLQLGTAEKPIVMDVDIASGNLSAGMLAANQSNTNFTGIYENITVYADMDINVPAGTANVGGLIGYVRTAYFTDCKVYGTMKASAENSKTYHNIGGIGGTVNNDGTQFLRCYNYADITVAGGTEDAQRAAGIFTYTAKKVCVIDCGNFGNLTAYAPDNASNLMQAAGILTASAVTDSNQITIQNCFNAGTIKSSQYAGSIVAIYNKNGKLLLNGNSNFGSVTRSASSPYSETETILGYVASGIATAGLTVNNSVEAPNGTPPTLDSFKETFTVNGYEVAKGSIAISTPEEFKGIEGALLKSYHLVNDIDFGGAEIENYMISRFNGTLNGCGYSIFNYSLKKSGTMSGDTGTIQRTGESALTTIKNLSVGKATAPIKMTLTQTTVSTSSAVFLGCAHANNLSIIDNVQVYADAEISTKARNNVSLFAGYAGRLYAKNCSTYGKLVGTTTEYDSYQNLAGFSANAANNSQIFENCYNYADIISSVQSKENRAGGFIGYTNTECLTLRNCGNFGKIYVKTDAAAAKDYEYSAGGLVALFNSNNKGVRLRIENCFNAGEIISKVHAGAMVARTNNVGVIQINNCTNYKAVTHGMTNTADALLMYGGAKSGVTAAVTVTNCQSKTDFTAADYASGKLTYDLNRIYGENTFCQDLGVDALPTSLAGSAPVLKLSDGTYSNGIALRGYQLSDMTGETFNIRFVATIDDVRYTRVGFKITEANNGKSWQGPAEEAYKELIVGSKNGTEYKTSALNAENDLGAKYIVAAAVINVPTGAAYSFTVTAYLADANGTEYTSTYIVNVAANGTVTYTAG